MLRLPIRFQIPKSLPLLKLMSKYPLRLWPCMVAAIECVLDWSFKRKVSLYLGKKLRILFSFSFLALILQLAMPSQAFSFCVRLL